ncbi:hypothetical protein HK097_001655 [Rhizophlyctis rosea]|uniref:Uncharacterized protein n=1 Tax=Rhizophlyctis rosea TaxID=64517 RepID=A0AAD5S4A4_9FUNG|nr:hypothetical protein HK097_001655 [Rhizophlyctis rosea]
MYRLIFLVNALVEGIPALLTLLAHIQGNGFPYLFPHASGIPQAELAAETAVLLMLTFATLPSLYIALSPALPISATKPVALGALAYHTFISLACLNRAVNVLPAIGPHTIGADVKAEWQMLGWSAVALHSGLAGAFVWVLRGGRSVPHRKER